MAKVKLKDAVYKKLEIAYPDGEMVFVRYQARPPLEAVSCDRCKKVFGFPKGQGHLRWEGQIGLWFEEDGENAASHTFHVCGLLCAQAILDGEYETIPVMSYDPPNLETFPHKGKKVRDHLMCIGNVITKEQLVKDWEKEEHRPPVFSQGGTHSSWKNALRLEGAGIEIVPSS